jgi:hypothetical protein
MFAATAAALTLVLVTTSATAIAAPAGPPARPPAGPGPDTSLATHGYTYAERSVASNTVTVTTNAAPQPPAGLVLDDFDGTPAYPSAARK